MHMDSFTNAVKVMDQMYNRKRERSTITHTQADKVVLMCPHNRYTLIVQACGDDNDVSFKILRVQG